MLFHVLDELDLFGIAVESSLHRQSINLFPLFKRKEDILLPETPYHDLVFPISIEYRSFVVLQELLEVLFIVKSDVKTLVEIPRLRVFVKMETAVGLCREIAIERFRLAVNHCGTFAVNVTAPWAHAPQCPQSLNAPSVQPLNFRSSVFTWWNAPPLTLRRILSADCHTNGTYGCSQIESSPFFSSALSMSALP